MPVAVGRRRRPSAEHVLALLPAVVIVLLIGLIVTPIGVVILTSLLSSPLGTKPTLTLANYMWLVTDSSSLPLLRNSAVFVAGASVAGLVLATLFAWLVTSVNIRGRRLLRLLPLMVLLAPPLLKDPAWIELYSSNIGLVNLAVMRVFGLDHAIFDVYSMVGMITTVGCNVVPIPYLVLLAPFESLDRSFIEASEMSGAGRARTLLRIVMPVLAPAFLSALALTLIVVASSFETPVLIGLPGGVGTYMSAIYRSMSTADPNLNHASAQATLYLALTGLLLAWYLVATRRERRFASVGGRGNATNSVRASGSAYLLTALLLTHFLVAFVLPVMVTVFVSLLPYYSISAGTPMPSMTLDNYQEMLAPRNLRAVVNSVMLSSVATICAVAAAVGLALVALKSRVPGRRLAEAIGTFPIGVPAIVFSVALLLTFISIPGVRFLYGTVVPLVLAEMIVFLPFALRVVSSSLIQIQDELLEASAVSGANAVQTGFRILLPLLKPALLYAGAGVFVLSFRELGAVVLLVTANTSLIPTETFTYWDNGNQGKVAALNMLSLLVPFVAVTAALAFGTPRRRRGERLAGLPLKPRRIL